MLSHLVLFSYINFISLASFRFHWFVVRLVLYFCENIEKLFKTKVMFTHTHTLAINENYNMHYGGGGEDAPEMLRGER